MAKYDDFGRPIYETAEEYNKAKKTGNRFSKSATERYAKQTSTKKTKSLVVGLAIFIVVFIVFVVLSMFNIVRDYSYDSVYQEHEDTWVDLDDDFGEYLGDDKSPLPEGFETFSYNGHICTLPTTFEEIIQMGFFLDEEYDAYVLFPRESEEMPILSDEGIIVQVRVSNYASEEIPMGKCPVNYFYIENPAAFDEEAMVPDFEFGDGLTLESDYEEVEAYFGIPYYHYADHSEGSYYDLYEWAYYGEEEIHFVSINFYNGVISNVSIEKKAYEEKY